jgi:hypothetical protein
VSIADGARHGEVRHYGVIASDLEPLDKVVKALRAPNRTCMSSTKRGGAGSGFTATSPSAAKTAWWSVRR